MRWLWIALFLMVGCNQGEKSQNTANQPMQIQFERVTLRQYKGKQLRFEAKAARVELNEETQEIQARDGVTATIEPKNWDRKQP